MSIYKTPGNVFTLAGIMLEVTDQPSSEDTVYMKYLHEKKRPVMYHSVGFVATTTFFKCNRHHDVTVELGS